LVLEVLKNEKTLQEIASANNITPKNLQNWKKIFLDNAEIAMEHSKVVKCIVSPRYTLFLKNKGQP
jgi:putative transposase